MVRPGKFNMTTYRRKHEWNVIETKYLCSINYIDEMECKQTFMYTYTTHCLHLGERHTCAYMYINCKHKHRLACSPYTHTQIHIRVRTHTYVHTHTYTHTKTGPGMHTHAYAQTVNTHTTHTHTHTHIYHGMKQFNH